ncbi:MAG TPA: AsmA family protein [Terriglobales bacterium]|nr:AsmA family protein [Terriglobales bacterium]
MKKVAAIGITIVALMIGALVLLPAFVDLGVFKRTYLPFVEETFHRNIDVDKVRLALLPAPSIRLSNLKVADSLGFPRNPLFNARQVQLRLKLWPLLRGRFEIAEFVLEQPVINLIKPANGRITHSAKAEKGIPAKRQETHKSPASAKSDAPFAMPLIVPRRLRIKDGQLNLQNESKNPVRISGINLSLEDFSSEQPFPFRASFNFAGLKTVSLEGQLDYREDQALLRVDHSQLKVHDLVLPVEGDVSSLSTAPRLNLALASDHVDALPVFKILSVFGLAPRDIKASGIIGLRVTVTGPSNALLARLQGDFQDIKIHDKRALKGNLSGDMSIRVPLGRGTALAQLVRGNGRFIARDGELTNVNLIHKIERVTGLMGFSRNERREATTFKTLEAECTLASGLADFKHIHLVNPQMEITGNGTMTLDRPKLNLALQARLSAQASARAGRGRAAAFFKDDQGRIVVPLRITGPVGNPAVNLDSEKMAEKGVSRSLEKSLGSFFKQLFRR